LALVLQTEGTVSTTVQLGRHDESEYERSGLTISLGESYDQ